MKSPTPEQIKLARENAGLTQTEAAEKIYCGLRAWQQWEYIGNNPKSHRDMHPGLWELFLIKTNQAVPKA